MSRIYLSSTYDDLKDHREAVANGLRRLNHEVVGVEDFVATDQRPLETSLHALAAADTYVGIFAHRYGYVPEGPDNPNRLSITELEYQHAKSRAIPCLVFLVKEDTPWPPQFIDRGESGEKLAALRIELRRSQVVGTFSSPYELASQVMTAVAKEVASRTFEVFFSYNAKDRTEVSELADRLQRDGIRVWMDIRQLKGGDEWQAVTQSAFAASNVVALFVGPNGIGDTQDREVRMALERKGRENERFRLIPVILPNASPELLPRSISAYRWVHFSRSLDDPAAYDVLKNAIRVISVSAPTVARPTQILEEQDLQMLTELLFRLVARLRERPEMLQSIEATAFWAAVRKIQPGASTIEDLRSINGQLSSSEPAPGALWAAWMQNTRATELAALLQHPDMTYAS